jgi:ankyrin repeat protein
MKNLRKKLRLLFIAIICGSFYNICFPMDIYEFCAITIMSEQPKKDINQKWTTKIFSRKTPEYIKNLLAQGADPNYAEHGSNPPLIKAMKNTSCSVDMLQVLLQAGASPNSNSISISTGVPTITSALCLAINKSRVDWAKALLHAGADPNLQDKKGSTALKMALINNSESPTTVQLFCRLPFVKALLQSGANPTLKDTGNKALLDYTDNPEIYRLLVRYGALPRSTYYFSNTTNFMGQEEFKDIFPHPLLQTIIRIPYPQDVKKLLAKQNSEVVKDDEGVSALVYAAGQGKYRIAKLLLQYPAYRKDTKSLYQAVKVSSQVLKGHDTLSKRSIENYKGTVLLVKNTLNENLQEIFRDYSHLPHLNAEAWDHVLTSMITPQQN